MAEQLDPKELVTIEEMAISGLREIAVLVEVLKGKGVFTRQDSYEMIRELRWLEPTRIVPPAQPGASSPHNVYKLVPHSPPSFT